MKPTSPDDFFWDHVAVARSMRPEERLRQSLDLFDTVRSLMEAGIRRQFPDADEQEVQRILWERLELSRKLEARRT
jgi:hypothetical protein